MHVVCTIILCGGNTFEYTKLNVCVSEFIAVYTYIHSASELDWHACLYVICMRARERRRWKERKKGKKEERSGLS